MILAMLSGHNRREEICRIRSYTDAGQNLSLTGPVAGRERLYLVHVLKQ